MTLYYLERACICAHCGTGYGERGPVSLYKRKQDNNDLGLIVLCDECFDYMESTQDEESE